MSSNIYDFTLQAAVNAVQRLEVQGSYFQLVSSSGGASQYIVARTDTGDVFKLLPGQGWRVPANRPPFNAVTLFNTAAVAAAGLVIVADADFIDNRITGDVSIIDNSASKTIAGGQFLGSAGKAAAGAGVYSMVGLIAGSRRVAVRRMTVSSTVPGIVYWGFGNAAPTTNYASAGSGISKLYTGAIATSQAGRWSATAANTPPIAADVPGVQGVASANLGANTETPIFDLAQAPIVLSGAGCCLWVHSNAANRDVAAVFDFEEQ